MTELRRALPCVTGRASRRVLAGAKSEARLCAPWKAARRLLEGFWNAGCWATAQCAAVGGCAGFETRLMHALAKRAQPILRPILALAMPSCHASRTARPWSHALPLSASRPASWKRWTERNGDPEGRPQIWRGEWPPNTPYKRR
ncbi:hypothetical protein VTN96DRAFT_9568 [Rasamsonia emersonii]|uniref:Uncharacterized protein n=1 Tax=Rasamsonia emersonii (strain ATCC 16479 / CBS 393.64 / IMI 116815) TaxID=1408163 RepID=A0A0F4YSB5_RASE3|nr:hypothetical protein T310_5229 [Rasamsonia emersonii CBS 393.64]KKA20731.1 hypothetical protein T310_5229 [Rasamsonia emersonii CBS 393.64]